MLTAVVTSSGSTIEVTLLGAPFVTAEEGEEAAGPESDLNPIAPELKEVVWGFGAFVVLALCHASVPVPQGARRDVVALRQHRGRPRAGRGAHRVGSSRRRRLRGPGRRRARRRPETRRGCSRHARGRAGREARPRPTPASPTSAAPPRPRSMPRSRPPGARSISAVADVSARLGELATGRRPSDDVVRAAVAQAMGQEVSA